ncbi:hypothetical protein F183_A02480 [Bryobacterales bacterium F-183]|nr:hypothetical protein F183_A02480 [Bryobacterales bacterium F-183]
MRLQTLAVILSTLSLPTFGDVIGFYSGDYEPLHRDRNWFINYDANVVVSRPTSMSVYQAFVVPAGGWTVTRLFTNTLLHYPAPEAYWEIRSGVSEGDGGTLLHSGSYPAPTVTPISSTNVKQVTVSGLSIFLQPGTYWMTVTPRNLEIPAAAFYLPPAAQVNTFGLNAIGTVPQNVVYANSVAYKFNFRNADGIFGRFPAVSAGVYIQSPPTSVPEPSELSILMTGAAKIWILLCYRKRR